MTDDARRRVGDVAMPAPPDGAEDDSLTWAQFRHLLHAPTRRPILVLVPWAAVIGLSVAALFVLPKKYMSSTLILVESEKVPESFIAKVATGDRSQRLEAVKPEILSRTRLERVLQETHPYPELDSRTRAVEKLRRSIVINVTGNDGFTIEFYHSDPKKAQEVTDRVARLFMEETVKAREQQVEGAVDFLVTQVKEARMELENKDAALRRYKEEHMGRLPEQLQTNLATMQMLQREMQTVEESLFLAHDKQESLAREIGRSSGTVGGSTPGATGSSEDPAELRRQLSTLRSRYTDDHPDVQSLRSRIARLEARAEEPQRPRRDEGVPIEVTRGQLDRTDKEVRKLDDRQRDLERRIAAVRAHVEETPHTEQELATLTRDYQKLNENYVTLLSKQLEAQMSGRLEQRWKGEQFRMLDPASLPERPVFPKPPIFIGFGVLLGFLVGMAMALTAEVFDGTVKDIQALQAVQRHPVLACLPRHPALAAAPRPLGLVVEVPGPGRAIDHPRPVVAAPPSAVVFREESVPVRRPTILASLRDDSDAVGEELRLLGTRLLDVCRRHEAMCLAVTSALPVEGKSTVSVGLCAALAEHGRRVLLIEADLRRPSLDSTLGLPHAPGLSEWLDGTADEVPLRVLHTGGFSVLSAGRTGLKRPEVLRSARMAALLREARSRFDLVILDAAPVLPVSDAVLMQDLVDGYLVVVRCRQTPREAIRDALQKLGDDRIVGLALNDHQEYRGSYTQRAYPYKGPVASTRRPQAVRRS